MKIQTKPLKLLIGLMMHSVVAFTAVASTPASVQQTQDKLIQIANSYEAAYFNHYPELAMYWGRNDAAQDRFMDHSMNSINAWQKIEDDYLKDLKKLNEKDLKETPAHNTYLLLRQTLENNQASRICKEELWNIDPLFGWHNILTMVAEKQVIGTPEAREQAIKRWQTFDTITLAEINKLKIGLKEGYSAPKPVVHRVLNQLNIIINSSPTDSPFFEFAKRDGDVKFKKQMSELITQVINPSLKRYAQYLENDYLPHARDTIAVSSLPCGAACYHAMVLKETTLPIKPNEIHEFGLSHMQQLSKEIAFIGQSEFGIQDMVKVFQRAKSDPRYLFHSEKEILDYNQKALERAKAKVLAWFDLMPKAKGVLKPYPLHRAKTGAAGEYHPPSDDGSRPGIFYINTYEPQKRNRIDQEATLFHELIPGHHFQVALAHENKSQHSLDKYLWNAGFGEGWALYAERLSDEMGLYKDNISRLGMLSNEALRTARLVVDPGIHVMGWSREQAVNYMKEHTAMADDTIEGEVDRYIMMPGQATSYMLGKREIESLRQLAKDQMGNKFDIKQFHNQVLKNGAVTLPMLQAQVKDWLESTKS